MSERLKDELHSFQSIWHEGYYEGNPLDPMAHSVYDLTGYMSVLHVVYLTCIKPHLNADTVALEIGPGRGAWTRCLLPAKEVWCLDALSAEHNGFWKYVGEQRHVKYFQVQEFFCSMLPDHHFDYLFSFGALCHVSFEGITAYCKNLWPKFKPGAHGFIMVADYDKFNRLMENIDRFNIMKVVAEKRSPWIKSFIDWYWARRRQHHIEHHDKNDGVQPRPGRWYHAGVEPTCAMLKSIGYEIVDNDMGVLHRDPMIHFRKPA